MRVCPKCGEQYEDEVGYCSTDGTQLGEADSLAPAGGAGPDVGSVLGSYRLLEKIGQGGMSHIFAAEHTRLGRRVAIKLLRSEYARDPITIKRFFQEARTVNTIKHENIVQITDFFEKVGGDSYYVMELLSGESLADLLKREGTLSWARTLRIAVQIARALQVVHDMGVVHRDLKPDNIYLIERAGRTEFVKLLDFGVAKLLDDRAGRALHQTAMGAIIGTPAYMSMEQAAGKPVDHRADIYSLGIIFYEMLSGLRPFDSESLGDLVIKHLTVEPPALNTLAELPEPVPNALETLIGCCLAKEPAGRPQSMIEVAERVEEILRQGGQWPDDQASPRGMSWTWCLVGALIAIGLGAGMLFWSWDKPSVVSDRGGGAPLPEVMIAFDSTPQGARVYLNGSGHSLGRTPCSISVSRSEELAIFELRLKDHRPARERVKPVEDQRLLVALGLKPVVPAAVLPGNVGEGSVNKKRKRNLRSKRKRDGDPRVPAKPDPGREGTVDPFGED